MNGLLQRTECKPVEKQLVTVLKCRLWSDVGIDSNLGRYQPWTIPTLDMGLCQPPVADWETRPLRGECIQPPDIMQSPLSLESKGRPLQAADCRLIN